MDASSLRFGTRAALVSAIAVIVCRIAIAAPAKTTESLYTQTPNGDLASYQVNPDGSLSLSGILKIDWQQDPGSRTMPLSMNLIVPPGGGFAYATDPAGRAANMICYPIARDTGALEPTGHCDSSQPIARGSGGSPDGQIFGVDPNAEIRPYSTNPSSERLVPAGGPIFRDSQAPPLVAFGKYVYMVCELCDTVSSLRFAPDGLNARAVFINQVPTGRIPVAIALDPNHQFAYVANSADSTISEYYIDPASRALKSNPKAQMAALHAEPFSIVTDPTGRFLYALGYPPRSREESLDPYEVVTNEVVDQFKIASDGTLEILGDPIRLFAGKSNFSRNGTILTDPSGRFVYVTSAVPKQDGSTWTKVIEGFRITSSGRLEALKSPPVPIFYDARATVSWIGPRPIVAAVQRDVTPLLALKAPLEGAFTQTGVLTAVPGSFMHANLLPDGRVFFLEEDPSGKIVGEVYDPAQATIADLGVILPRDSGPSVVAALRGDKYLLRLSGLDKRAAIFGPEAMKITPIGRLGEPCYRDYWRLNDGRILFPQIIEHASWGYMGSVSPNCGGEIYDPSTGKSTALPPVLNKLFLQVFAKLADGELLFHMNPPYWDWRRFGGPGAHPGDLDPRFKQYDPQEVSIFDAKTGKAKPAGRMPDRLISLNSVTLKDGTVFIAGGTDDSPTTDSLSSSRAELYDPVAGAFVELGPLLRKRDGGCALTLLKDGRVLISGGRNDVELFDPATRRFSPGGTMNNFHAGVNPLLLNDGTVLIAGNDFNGRGDAPQTIEIYHPLSR
jgi:lactonase family protein with 7-bladed beta-propeller